MTDRERRRKEWEEKYPYEGFERIMNEKFTELEKREKELENNFNAGVLQGIKIMQQRMLLACENGTPINIEGRAYFVKSDLQNLQHIFSDLEADTE